jgi:predicted site-specific integrase-resolvase
MENVGTKHISTIRTFLAEGSIKCIVQQSNHLSIKNETMSTTAFTAVFTVTVGSSIMSIHMLFYSLMISE